MGSSLPLLVLLIRLPYYIEDLRGDPNSEKCPNGNCVGPLLHVVGTGKPIAPDSSL